MFVFLVSVYSLLQICTADTSILSFLNGTWTSPAWDIQATVSTPPQCCIPDNITFTPLTENGSLINVTYRFTSVNLACQVYFRDSEVHQGSWNASVEPLQSPGMFLTQIYVTGTQPTWLGSNNYIFGQSVLFPLYLKVNATPYYCSFYMTNKLNDSVDSINRALVESSTTIIPEQQISAKEMEDLLFSKIQPYLISFSVILGIQSILLLFFSLNSCSNSLARRTKISTQKTLSIEEIQS